MRFFSSKTCPLIFWPLDLYLKGMWKIYEYTYLFGYCHNKIKKRATAKWSTYDKLENVVPAVYPDRYIVLPY